MKFVALHIIYLERTMIEVMESALQKAAGEGMDEFIQVFTDKYKEVIGGELTEMCIRDRSQCSMFMF